MSHLKIFLLIMTLFFRPSQLRAAEERCDQTTLDEIDCYKKVADRAELQLEKDWNYLIQLAQSRNHSAVRYFNVGSIAFRHYVNKNCQSEGHDALGGSLEEVLYEKCRRDTYLARHRLYERIGEGHPLGRSAEKVFGRPVCESFLDPNKPTEVGTEIKVGDIDLLRRRLDKKAEQAVAEGLSPAVKSLLRSTHAEAESLRAADAVNTCQGILKAFCQPVSADHEIASEWLSRCQTEIRSAYYRRASQRLRQYQLLELQN